MNIVIAPDSFKGSLSALNAGTMMRKAFEDEWDGFNIRVIPMADGGEGTLDTLVYSTNGKQIEVEATGPLGEKIKTVYGMLGDMNTAVIEMANIAGLPMVPKDKLNPLNTTSYGIGEVILDAADKGCRRFIVGLGGSATNDGGLGMLQALGVTFLDENNEVIEPYGHSVGKVRKVDFSTMKSIIKDCYFQIASDVDNPLCGPKGASYIFGPQKGADKQMVEELDQALKSYGEVIEQTLNKNVLNLGGAGAAGGLGFAFLLLNSKLESGAKLVAEFSNLAEAIHKADWVLTGEGQSDYQTLYGKVPSYVAKVAKQYNVNTSLVSGSLGKGFEKLYEDFISCHSITKGPMRLEECMIRAGELLYSETKNIARLLRAKI
ncbi:glycerate kinase [Aquibacillus albus]|uniref:Glycerate kinase n=1 Tax=Aquibacillus albus TaxID=1168171 RepID=A0ABS2N0I4_9BACI|nr:glycerate kinase [Aquibacillus albus]MBM7571659.1 glycerate kinase [Aquibacillus albus]